MPELSRNLIIISVVVLLLLAMWVLSIGVTCWDVLRRKKLSEIEKGAWIALVVLIPGIGFAGYLLGRLLGVILSPGGSPAGYPRRFTRLKPPPQVEQRSSTILGADLLPSKEPRVRPPQETSTSLDDEKRSIYINVMAGPHIGAEYVFDNLPIKIGRGNDVAVPLDDDLGVSRLHAEIYERKGALRIRDLNSSHGTKVNDLKISDKSLESGDKIRIGASMLKVRIQEERL